MGRLSFLLGTAPRAIPNLVIAFSIRAFHDPDWGIRGDNGATRFHIGGTLLMHWLWLRWFQPVVFGFGLGILAMVLHECGHLAAAAALGVRVKRIGIQWNKGFFTVREQGTVHQNLIIALAGPSVNLLLVVVEPWFPMFSLANVCCVIANMLPIAGSDGFRVADCWRKIREGELAN